MMSSHNIKFVQVHSICLKSIGWSFHPSKIFSTRITTSLSQCPVLLVLTLTLCRMEVFKGLTRLESTGTSPGIWNLDFELWTLDFFYELRMTQGYQLDHSLSQRLVKHIFDNVLLKHVGLIYALSLAVHLFFFVLSR